MVRSQPKLEKGWNRANFGLAVGKTNQYVSYYTQNISICVNVKTREKAMEWNPRE